MLAGHFPNVLHSQRKPRLVTANRLMLRAVIGKHAAHVLQLGNCDHIDHENHNAEDALEQMLHQNPAAGPPLEEVSKLNRKQEKEQQGEAEAENQGERDHNRHEFLTAHLFFQPGFQPGRTFLFLLLALGLLLRRLVRRRVLFFLEVRLLRGPHQALDAREHGAAKVHDSTDQRPRQNPGLLFQRVDFCHKSLPGLANDDGLLFRAAHHNSFDQSLSADHGFELFPGRAGWILLIHSPPPLIVYCVTGSDTVTRVPPPSAFSSVSVPP